MSDLTPERATALRRPFPAETIGKLPKGGVMLDYVGHAAVTDRLLTVDPTWSWEPFSIGPDGLPALDRSNNLWIRLTICGVTRIGVGDGKSAKECIGDAIRNAAMRFGVALDLWAKEDLVEFAQAAQSHRREPEPPPATEPPPIRDRKEREDGTRLLDPRSSLAKAMFAAMRTAGIDDKDARLALCSEVTGREIASSADMTEAEARMVLDNLAPKAGA